MIVVNCYLCYYLTTFRYHHQFTTGCGSNPLRPEKDALDWLVFRAWLATAKLVSTICDNTQIKLTACDRVIKIFSTLLESSPSSLEQKSCSPATGQGGHPCMILIYT